MGKKLFCTENKLKMENSEQIILLFSFLKNITFITNLQSNRDEYY